MAQGCYYGCVNDNAPVPTAFIPGGFGVGLGIFWAVMMVVFDPYFITSIKSIIQGQYINNPPEESTKLLIQENPVNPGRSGCSLFGCWSQNDDSSSDSDDEINEDVIDIGNENDTQQQHNLK